MRDFFVDAHDGIRLAVRDHEGDGPPLVLLHGAGSHLLSVGYLAHQLRDFHVVTMDQRWSGWSGDSDAYRWDDLVADVEAVAGAVGFDNPIVVGHSWGGMIAAYYGARHPEAPAVANLDGHGSPTDLSLLDGMDGEAARKALDALRSAQVMLQVTGASGDREWYAQQRQAAIVAARAGGLREDRAVEFAERSFVDRGDGTWVARPAGTLMEGLNGDLGLFDVYRQTKCPLLVLNCQKDQVGMPPEAATVMGPYRRGLTRALTALAAEAPNLSVVHLPDVDHQSIAARDAPVVADTLREFFTRVGAIQPPT